MFAMWPEKIESEPGLEADGICLDKSKVGFNSVSLLFYLVRLLLLFQTLQKRIFYIRRRNKNKKQLVLCLLFTFGINDANNFAYLDRRGTSN